MIGTSKQTQPAGEQKLLGFASMPPELLREISSQGGRAAHELGVANEFTPEQARAAGQRGGATRARDRERMSQLGKKGGAARAASARLATTGPEVERAYWCITQRALARRAGVSLNTVRRYEAGAAIRRELADYYTQALTLLIGERLRQNLERAATLGVTP